MRAILVNLIGLAFFAWLYATLFRAKTPAPTGHRIKRPRRNELRRNRYILPGERS